MDQVLLAGLRSRLVVLDKQRETFARVFVPSDILELELVRSLTLYTATLSNTSGAIASGFGANSLTRHLNLIKNSNSVELLFQREIVLMFRGASLGFDLLRLVILASGGVGLLECSDYFFILTVKSLALALHEQFVVFMMRFAKFTYSRA